MSEHVAEQTVTTRIKEHQAWALGKFGTTPDGNGAHRAGDESFADRIARQSIEANTAHQEGTQ